jgi:hypothetical protein
MNRIIVAVCALLLTFSYSSADKLKIGAIPKDSLSDGCGYYFWNEADSNLICFDKNFINDTAKININNNIIRIIRIKREIIKKGKQNFNIGDKTIEIYKNNEIELKLEYEVIKICPESNPDCESTDYKGKIEMQNIRTKEIITIKLLGNSGC